MTQFGTITVGRFPLVEFPTQVATDASAAPSGSAPTGRTLKIQGQESVPSATEINTTPTMLEAWRADMAALVGSFLSVVFTDKVGLNGYYVVTDSSADLQNWEGEQQTLSWSMDLVRIGTDFEVDVESRLTGGTRANSFALTGVRWHSPSIGHYAYFSASGNTPGVVVRTGADGNHVVYVNLPSTQTTIPRWGCAVGNYMSGRVKFVDMNGIERSGILFSNGSPTSWTLSNGLVQVTPAVGGGVVDVANYAGPQSAGGTGGYSSKRWDFLLNGVSLGTPLGVSLLRNEPEIVVMRLVFSYQTTRVTCDLTLRRGARHIEVFLQTQVSGQFKVVRVTPEIATSSTGYISAASEDSSGNTYVLGSALSFTSDLVNGGISSSASVLRMDAMIGAQASQAVLNANPYFETNLTSWTAFNGSAARSSAHAHQGTWAMQMTPDGVSSLAQIGSETIAVTPGSKYDATGWAWPTSAVGTNLSVGINWFTSAAGFISSSVNTAAVTSGTWNFLNATRNATAPASAALATVVVSETGTPPASATVWWDEVKLRPSVPTGDAASDLYNQYLATPSELVQGIRR